MSPPCPGTDRCLPGVTAPVSDTDVHSLRQVHENAMDTADRELRLPQAPLDHRPLHFHRISDTPDAPLPRLPITPLGNSQTVSRPPITRLGVSQRPSRLPITRLGISQPLSRLPITRLGISQTLSRLPIMRVGISQTLSRLPITRVGISQAPSTLVVYPSRRARCHRSSALGLVLPSTSR